MINELIVDCVNKLMNERINVRSITEKWTNE